LISVVLRSPQVPLLLQVSLRQELARLAASRTARPASRLCVGVKPVEQHSPRGETNAAADTRTDQKQRAQCPPASFDDVPNLVGNRDAMLRIREGVFGKRDHAPLRSANAVAASISAPRSRCPISANSVVSACSC